MGRDLKGVIRLRKWEVDEKRRALRELLDREAQIQEFQRRLSEEMLAEAVAAQANPREAGAYLGAYTKKALERQRTLAEALRQVRAEIEQAQDAVAEAFKELKTFEIAQENREDREAAELDRKVQIMQDEIGLTLHRRRDKGK